MTQIATASWQPSLIIQFFKFQSSALFQNSIYFPSPSETVTFCFGSTYLQYFGNILKLEAAVIVVLASCASLFPKITFLCWNLSFIYFPKFPFLHCSRISQIPNSPELPNFPGGPVEKTPPANAGNARDVGSNPGSGRSSGTGNCNPLEYSSLKFHGQRSLAGYSPWTCKELDMTEQLGTRASDSLGPKITIFSFQ